MVSFERCFGLRFILRVAAALAVLSSAAMAATVGEAHLRATSPTGALRNASHDADLRVTIWYPATNDAVETPRRIGPPDQPLYEGGSASDDALLATSPLKLPVILLSHGFGGSARMMSWFGTEVARAGYLVVAVDHPGNNGRDPMTGPGAVLWWDRADDLHEAWNAVRSDPRFARRVDPSRLGVAGFSAGGFAALVAAGARIDLAQFDLFCIDHPEDSVCLPQAELKGVSGKDRRVMFDTPAMKEAESQASGDHSIPGVRSAFVLAPALVQALAPDGLRDVSVPTDIMLGSADRVAPPATNGEVAARLIPKAKLVVLDHVGHYDFLANCTEAGQIAKPTCRFDVPQNETHHAAILEALAFFASTLRPDALDGP